MYMCVSQAFKNGCSYRKTLTPGGSNIFPERVSPRENGGKLLFVRVASFGNCPIYFDQDIVLRPLFNFMEGLIYFQ